MLEVFKFKKAVKEKKPMTYDEFQKLPHIGLRPEITIAVIVATRLKGLDSGRREPGTIEECSELVAKVINEHGIRTGLALSCTPKPPGFYSRSIDDFFSRFEFFGYASFRQTERVVALHEDGIKSCRRLVKEGLETNPEAVKTLCRIFDLSEDKL